MQDFDLYASHTERLDKIIEVFGKLGQKLHSLSEKQNLDEITEGFMSGLGELFGK